MSYELSAIDIKLMDLVDNILGNAEALLGVHREYTFKIGTNELTETKVHIVKRDSSYYCIFNFNYDRIVIKRLGSGEITMRVYGLDDEPILQPDDYIKNHWYDIIVAYVNKPLDDYRYNRGCSCSLWGTSSIDNIVYREVGIEIYETISGDERFYSAVMLFNDPDIIEFMGRSTFDLPLYGGTTINEVIGGELIIGFDCRRSRTEPKSKEFIIEESTSFIDYIFEKYEEEKNATKSICTELQAVLKDIEKCAKTLLGSSETYNLVFSEKESRLIDLELNKLRHNKYGATLKYENMTITILYDDYRVTSITLGDSRLVYCIPEYEIPDIYAALDTLSLLHRELDREIAADDRMLMSVEGYSHAYSGEYRGYEIYVLNNYRRGCGSYYTGYAIIDNKSEMEAVEKFKDEIDVHGGVSYCRCHDDYLEVGFDCNWLDDITDPKTKEFAIEECKRMVDSIIEKLS